MRWMTLAEWVLGITAAIYLVACTAAGQSPAVPANSGLLFAALDAAVLVVAAPAFFRAESANSAAAV